MKVVLFRRDTGMRVRDHSRHRDQAKYEVRGLLRRSMAGRYCRRAFADRVMLYELTGSEGSSLRFLKRIARD